MNDLARAQINYQILDENTVALDIDLDRHPHLRDSELVHNNMLAFVGLYSPRIWQFEVQYLDISRLVIVVRGDMNHVVQQTN